MSLSVLPVFITQRSLPGESDRPYTVSEVCGACEKKTGYGSILGAQKLGSLWRIYPTKEAARTNLLLSGVSLRGCLVTLCDKNPFVVQTRDGEREIQTTKVTIGGLPISFSNEDIEAMLAKLGAVARSALFMERDRDSSGGLTRWLTGRRFMYIEVPAKPLPAKVDLASFKATIYHAEQKQQPKLQQKCGRCLQMGHIARACTNEMLCFDCKKPGHKKGSPDCSAFTSLSNAAAHPPEDQHNTDSSNQASSKEEEAGLLTPRRSRSLSNKRRRGDSPTFASPSKLHKPTTAREKQPTVTASGDTVAVVDSGSVADDSENSVTVGVED